LVTSPIAYLIWLQVPCILIVSTNAAEVRNMMSNK